MPMSATGINVMSVRIELRKDSWGFCRGPARVPHASEGRAWMGKYPVAKAGNGSNLAPCPYGMVSCKLRQGRDGTLRCHPFFVHTYCIPTPHPHNKNMNTTPTKTAVEALQILVRLGRGRPVKAATFGRAMWPEPGSRPIPSNSSKRNLLAGGYLSKLVKKGWVERVYNDSSELMGYLPTPEGLALIRDN